MSPSKYRCRLFILYIYIYIYDIDSDIYPLFKSRQGLLLKKNKKVGGAWAMLENDICTTTISIYIKLIIRVLIIKTMV
jgi:hypothetical protein